MNKYREAFDKWRDYSDNFKHLTFGDDVLDMLEEDYSLFHDAFYIAEIMDALLGDGWFDRLSQFIEKGEDENE